MKKVLVALSLTAGVAVAVGLCACNSGTTDVEEPKTEVEINFIVGGQKYDVITADDLSAADILPENPAVKGYEFGGWYLDDGVWTLPFSVDSLDGLSASADIDVYAKMDAITYTVTYNSGGGVHENLAEYTVESPTITLSAAEKTGYTFEGWYSSDTFDTKITAIATGSYGDLFFYAKFSVNSYAISFDSDGGSAVESITGEYGAEVKAPVPPAKLGYTFGGWYEGDSDTAYAFTTMPAGDVSLKAKWEKIAYAITYNLDGGSNSPLNPQSYTVESVIPLADAVKENYTFDGWYTDGEFKERLTVISAGSLGDIVLYAKFIPESYTITYKNTKGAINGNPAAYTIESGTITLEELEKPGYTFTGWYDGGTRVSEIVAGSVGDITLTAYWVIKGYKITYHGDNGAVNDNPVSYDIESEPLKLTELCKEGYTFAGWYTDENYTNLITEIAAGTVGDLNLYAKWETIAYTATFKADDKTVATKTFTVENLFVEAPAVPDKTGYTGEWEEYVLSACDIEVNAVYTVITYTVAYENEKGAVNENVTAYTIESETITLSDISAAGYTFDGWFNGETKITEIAKGSAGDMTLTAKWTPLTYTITYENEKGAENDNPATYTVESDTVVLEELETPGYTFSGWYRGGEKIVEIASGSMGDMTLTAYWIVKGYKITYHGDKGAVNDNPVSYDVEDEPLKLTELSEQGYTFAGWYTDENYTNPITEIAAGTVGDLNLYAKWEVIAYTATFKADGETVATETFTVENLFVEAPAVPDKKGYTGEWEEYALTAADITITAAYVPVNYTITYENAKGAVNENVTAYTIESETITLSDIAATGYTFDGWFNGETKMTEIAKGSSGDMTLTAKWTAVTYTITYADTKGAANDNPITYTIESEDITLLDITAVGYTFIGWYKSGEKVTEIAAGGYGNIKLTAEWEIITYEITYHNVGGATNGNAATYDVEDEPLKLTAAIRTGYTFAGWYTDENYTELIAEIAAGTAGDRDLYAKWTVKDYTATFTADGETVATRTFTVENFTITAPDVPEKAGYTGVWEDYALTTSDTTICAVYTLINYIIAYENAKGAANDNLTAYTVESDTITLTALEKTGYTFDGWYDGETKVTGIVTGSTGNLTLTAKWTAIAYTITYNYDESIGGLAEGDTLKTTYTIEDEFTFAVLINKTEGYTFNGWYTEETFGAGDEATGIKKGATGDKVYYAQWIVEPDEEPEIYTITYYNVDGVTNANATTYTTESETFTIGDLSRTGYIFGGWYSDEELQIAATTTVEKGSAGNLNFYAKWEATEYAITYVLYGGGYESGSNPETYTVEDEVTFVSPVRDGYAFAGWYTAAEGGDIIEKIEKGATGDLTIYARWTYISTISFNTNGGSAVESITATAGTLITAPMPPAKDYYTFAGWYSDEELTSEYAFGTMPGSDITLYAKWAAIEYSITYVLNGGINNSANPSTYTVEDTVTFAEPTKMGYTFAGWFTDAEFTSEPISGIVAGSCGEITIYADFSINSCTISFETNGGSAVAAITQNCGTEVTAPDSPSKDGYTFVGWYSDEELTTEYTFDTMPGSDITLYAKWEEDYREAETYTVTIAIGNAGGGTVAGGGECVSGNEVTITATSNPGYDFKGWYDEDGNVIADSADYTFAPDADVTYTAEFEVKEEMSVFEFTSDTSSCEITGFKGGATPLVTIPDYVTSIAQNAFKDCLTIITVTVGAGVESIGESAFEGCYKLIEVCNLSSLTITTGSAENGYIGYYAENVCASADDESKKVSTNGSGLVFYKDTACYLVGYVGESSSILLPNKYKSVEYEIYKYAFYGCTLLESVTINSTGIGEYAFYGCTALTSVTMSSGVTEIGEYAFSGCTALTDIVICKEVTEIGVRAFYGCTALSSATFKSTSTWKRYKNGISSGTIYSTKLAAAGTAAEYLRSTYCEYSWVKS